MVDQSFVNWVVGTSYVYSVGEQAPKAVNVSVSVSYVRHDSDDGDVSRY